MKIINKQSTRSYLLGGLIILLSVINGGCVESSSYSDNLSTKNLSVEMHVSNNGDQIINVEVMLRNGSLQTGDSVVISGDEQLIISTIGGDYRNLIDSGNFNSINSLLNDVKILNLGLGINSTFFNDNLVWFYNQFDIQKANEEFTLILERPTRLTSNKSTVKLPEQFVIMSPLASDSYSRLGDIIVSWDNSQFDSSMSLIASLICVSGDTQVWESGEIYPDTGIFTIPANTFINLPGVCSLTIRVTRTNLGILDPVFTLGGIILGHQIRTTVINTVP